MIEHHQTAWAISQRAFEIVSKREVPKDAARPGAVAPQGMTGTAANGVAVISVTGVLQKRADWMTEIFGDTAMQNVGAALLAADADPAIKSIILAIDSPGGTVDGTEELAAIVAGISKPVIAVADGMMMSAAYWIGSAADAVYLSSRTAEAGSIGVIATHMDISGFESQMGVKTTLVTAGTYKAAANPYEPLTGDGKAVLQGLVDGIYSVFIDTVAKNRGVSAQNVLENMADGRVFMGDQAIEAGLADGYMTVSEAVSAAMDGKFTVKSSPKRLQGRTSTPKGVKSMDIKTLRAEHPEIVSEMTREITEAVSAPVRAAAFEEGRAAGVASETQRIMDIEANALPGHDALVAAMKADGKTTGAEAAVKILQAEKAKGATRLAAIRDDAQVVALVPGVPAPSAAPVDDGAAKTDEQYKAIWEASPALRAEFEQASHYAGFARARAAGKVRLHSARKGA